MSKIEEILLEEYKDHSFARIIIKNTHLQKAMKEFGKICFEAARTNDYGRGANIGDFIDESWVIDAITGVCYGGHAKYLNYEEFLREIENENI